MHRIGFDDSDVESSAEGTLVGSADSTVASDAAHRPGLKTTEFWLTGVVIVVVAVLVLFDKVSVEQVVDLWPIFMGLGTYTLSRGLVKSGR